ncbi:uncharacterized protein LOC118403730 [Branchiostoma floridae]|uniref:Uncharacterized protein LOC118403730 n=1 Tax=Branchiostoma floridae TaxID=7739 RepID=A0A9J7HI15_BRAFL|nr:uncharacterized protein LOC118403730 [Branchiostoma floridae]
MGHEDLSASVRKQVGAAIVKEGKEMAATSVLGHTSCEDLKSFTLADVNRELEDQAPLMSECLRASCGYKTTGYADVAVATAASICLRVPYPTLSALQYRNSFVLLHAGAKKRAFQRFNRQQMCMSHKSTISKQREAGELHDSTVLKWRTDIEHYFMAQRVLETIKEATAEEEAKAEKAMLDKSGDSSSTISFADLSACGFSVKAVSSDFEDLDLGVSILQEGETNAEMQDVDLGVGVLPEDKTNEGRKSLSELAPGYPEGAYAIANLAIQDSTSTESSHLPYSTATILKAISAIAQYFPEWFQLCFDNVDLNVTPKHQGRDNTTKSYHWVHQYAAKDRVKTDLPNTAPQKALKDFDLTDVLPTEEVQQLLRKDFIVDVGRMMVKRIPAFKCLEDVAVWHIPHPYEEEMAQKSEQVWLGLQFKNENVNAEMADILKYFHKYVPAERDEDGNIERLLQVVLLGGDWLSQERADNIQGAFRDGDDPLERLEGVLGKYELWHGERNLTEVQDKVFHKDSPADKGSLCSNMNVTRSLSAKKGPHAAYNPYKEFMAKNTEALVLYACMVVFGWESLDGKFKYSLLPL